jgi:hypothetical protein
MTLRIVKNTLKALLKAGGYRLERCSSQPLFREAIAPESIATTWASYSSVCPYLSASVRDDIRERCRRVSAVIVTRGDRDLSPILCHLPFEDVVVWDNSKRPHDLKVFGRFAAVREARNDIIYTQDDDCVVRALDLVGSYTSGAVTTNMPAERRLTYADGVALIGWGAIFDRRLVLRLNRYLRHWPCDELFLRECDRVFTAFNAIRYVEAPFQPLNAHPARTVRMSDEARHLNDLAEIRRRIASARAAAQADQVSLGYRSEFLRVDAEA